MTQEFVTLPREVVQQALAALDAEDPYRAAIALRAALEQPQRKLTPQDIADSALLGNIESPFNACMHQEHCKRWKAQAEQHVADHQRESSIDNDLPSENGQLITTSSSVPFGYKLAPVEPTVEMMDAGGAATRRCYQHLNKDEVMCSYVYRHMLAAAPHPPTVKECLTVEQQQGGQEPVALLADAIRSEPTELIHKWRVLELIQDHAKPQPKREPLTDDDVKRLWYQNRGGLWYQNQGISLRFARSIEAAHNIK